jgi:hypothetical protein
MRLGIAAISMLALATPAAAQHQHAQSPYSDLQQREIKALSEQQ